MAKIPLFYMLVPYRLAPDGIEILLIRNTREWRFLQWHASAMVAGPFHLAAAMRRQFGSQTAIQVEDAPALTTLEVDGGYFCPFLGHVVGDVGTAPRAPEYRWVPPAAATDELQMQVSTHRMLEYLQAEGVFADRAGEYANP